MTNAFPGNVLQQTLRIVLKFKSMPESQAKQSKKRTCFENIYIPREQFVERIFAVELIFTLNSSTRRFQDAKIALYRW